MAISTASVCVQTVPGDPESDPPQQTHLQDRLPVTGRNPVLDQAEMGGAVMGKERTGMGEGEREDVVTAERFDGSWCSGAAAAATRLSSPLFWLLATSGRDFNVLLLNLMVLRGSTLPVWRSWENHIIPADHSWT